MDGSAKRVEPPGIVELGLANYTAAESKMVLAGHFVTDHPEVGMKHYCLR